MPLAPFPPAAGPRRGSLFPPADLAWSSLARVRPPPPTGGPPRTAAVTRLAAIMTVRPVARHAMIFHEEDPAEQLFVVRSGTVKLGRLLPDGRHQVIGFLFAGDVLGLEADGHHLCHAEAVTPVTLGCLPRRRLEAAIGECPDLAHALLAVAAHELAAAQEHVVLLGRRTAPERIAAFLLGLARRAAEGGHSGAGVPLPMTRGDIADYLGLATETVSRTLARWQRLGLLGQPEHGRVAVLDRAALERLAASD